ncbi:hypothetical protein [Nocardioides sp.]
MRVDRLERRFSDERNAAMFAQVDRARLVTAGQDVGVGWIRKNL